MNVTDPIEPGETTGRAQAAPRDFADLVMPWATPTASDAGAAPVTGVCLDSRVVRAGDLYVALPGTRAHGADFAEKAVAAGAAGILTDAEGASLLDVGIGVPIAVAADLRGSMARIAADLYAHPADTLTMFGVTGTNGKTTTTFLLAAALRGIGVHVGSVGTLGFELDGQPLRVARTTVTTPESIDLQALLALMRERGAQAVAMEVSSHAMVQRRTEPVRFDVAAFTNLSPEHLDFHPDMEHYFEAKASLFSPEHCRAAVVNIDDPAGARLAERIRATEVELRTVSWQGRADYRIAEVSGRHVRLASGLEFDLLLPGDFNVTNAVTALAMIDLAGLDVAAAASALAAISVPGRMQPVDLPAGAPTVFVDFAHTPEAVRSALAVFGHDRARGRRVIAVLGCGGDRDRVKREPMGRVAAENADIVVVTDDNPRSEDPATIRARVLAGARSVTDDPTRVIDGGERRAAIGLALRTADVDDVVVVLGKGHEQGQEIKGRVNPFDDAGVIVEEWRAAEEDR